MEGKAKESTVLITLELPADAIGLKIVRCDMQGYESTENVTWGMLRDVIRPEEGYEERVQA